MYFVKLLQWYAADVLNIHQYPTQQKTKNGISQCSRCIKHSPIPNTAETKTKSV